MTQQYPYPYSYQPAYQPPLYPYQSPPTTYPTLPNSSVLQTTNDANNFQTLLSNLQSQLLNGQQTQAAQPQQGNILEALNQLLNTPQGEVLKNVIGNLQNNQNNQNSPNPKEGNQTTSSNDSKIKTTPTESQNESLVSMMMKLLSGNNNQTSENLESKIFDIYAYKAMDSIVGKIATASKPIDTKYIAQASFNIADAMVAERKKRLAGDREIQEPKSESTMKMTIDDTIIPKPAQEAIVEM
jgi:hypothetical protein